MELKLNDIFNLTEQEIKNSKIELNMTKGQKGSSYIDLWLALDEEIKKNGKNNRRENPVL